MSRNTTGTRHRTRGKFSVDFRKHGVRPTTNVLRRFKKGDLVNIVGTGACQKGLPYTYYHGKTGKIVSMGHKTVQVEIIKKVKTRTYKKYPIVRTEHIVKNTAQEEFKRRKEANLQAFAAAKEAGIKISTKRLPAGPEKACFVSKKVIYDILPEYV